MRREYGGYSAITAPVEDAMWGGPRSAGPRDAPPRASPRPVERPGGRGRPPGPDEWDQTAPRPTLRLHFGAPPRAQGHSLSERLVIALHHTVGDPA